MWGKSGKSHFWREVAPFWILSFVGLAFSSVAVWLAGEFARSHGLHHGATALLVNLANLVSFAILWIVKFVIYNKLFHVDPVEYEEHHAEKRGCRIRRFLAGLSPTPAGISPGSCRTAAVSRSPRPCTWR